MKKSIFTLIISLFIALTSIFSNINIVHSEEGTDNYSEDIVNEYKDNQENDEDIEEISESEDEDIEEISDSEDEESEVIESDNEESSELIDDEELPLTVSTLLNETQDPSIDVSNLKKVGIAIQVYSQDDIDLANAFMSAEEGDSKIVIENVSSNKKYIFRNVHCKFDNITNTLIIRNEGSSNHDANFLAASYIVDGSYNIEISVNGVQNKISFESVSLNGICSKLSNKFEIRNLDRLLTTSANGNDTLFSYYKELTNSRKTKGYNSFLPGKEIGGIFTGGYVELYDSSNNCVATYYGKGSSGSSIPFRNGLMYSEHNKSVEIEMQVLIDDKLLADIYTLKYYAPGYEPYVIENVNLVDILCKPALPADEVTVTTLDNGDLCIDSNNDNWSKALVKSATKEKKKAVKENYSSEDGSALYEVEVILGGGFIEFDTGDENIKLQNIGDDIKYKYILDDKDPNYKCIIINHEILEANNIIDPISIVLSPEGYGETYKECVPPTDIDDSNVSVSVNVNGGIEITCSDETNKENYISAIQTGSLEIDNIKFKITNDDIVNNKITIDENKIVISKEKIKEICGNITGTVDVKINASRFVAISKSIVLPYIANKSSINIHSLELNSTNTYKVGVDINQYDIVWKLFDDNNNEVTESDMNNSTINAKDNGEFEIIINDLNYILNNASKNYFVKAEIYNSGETENPIYEDTFEIDITAPKINISLAEGRSNKEDVYVGENNVQISALASLVDATDVSDYLSYKSSDESIATVDSEGNINFVSNGKVKITAFIGSNETFIEFSVYRFNKDKKITMNLVDNMYQIEIGSKNYIQFMQDGSDISNEIEEYLSVESFKFNNNDCGVIEKDANGFYIKGKRISSKVSLTLTILDSDYIIKGQTTAILNNINIVNKIFTELSFKEIDDGILIYETNDIGNSFQLIPIGKDLLGESFEISNVKYVSLDSKVVAVNSSGLITIKKAGQTRITATISSNPKTMDPVKCDLIVIVKDYSPKLNTNKITLNKYDINGSAIINMYAAYDSSITNVSINSNNYDINYANDIITLKVKDDKRDVVSSGKQILTVVTNKGTYDFAINISIVNKLPNINCNVLGTYNSFTGKYENLKLDYLESEVDHVEFIDDWADYNMSSHELTLKTINNKLIKSGIVRLFYKNYKDSNGLKYVDKKVSCQIITTKPVVKLETSNVSIYSSNLINNQDITFRLIDKDKNPVEGFVSINNSEYMPLDGNGYYTVEQYSLSNNSMTISYKGSMDWPSHIDNRLTIKVSNSLPTAKLDNSSLVINKKFYSDSEKIKVLSSTISNPIIKLIYNNLPEGLTIENSGDNDATNDFVRINPEKVSNGSYKINVTPYIKVNDEDVALKTIVLTVKVVEQSPKLTFKVSTVKFNKKCNETIANQIVIKNNVFGNTILSFDGFKTFDNINNKNIAVTKLSLNAPDLICTYKDNSIELKLNGNYQNTATGNYQYQITPIYNNVESDPITFAINVYDKDISAKISIKGSLNQLNLEDKVTGTIKLSNINDSINSVEVINNDKIECSYDATTDVVQFSLTNNAVVNGIGINDQTMKVSVKITTKSGKELIVDNVSIKISRKSPTVKLKDPTVYVYNMTSYPNVVASTSILLSENNVTLRDVEVIPKDATSSQAYNVTYDQGKLIITLLDPTIMKSDSTVSFSIKLYWNGDYEKSTSKPTILTLKIKDASNSIKPN